MRERWTKRELLVAMDSDHGILAARQGPARPWEVAGVAVRVGLQVVLVLWLGLPERPRRGHFGDDLAGPSPDASTSAMVSSATWRCSSSR